MNEWRLIPTTRWHGSPSICAVSGLSPPRKALPCPYCPHFVLFAHWAEFMDISERSEQRPSMFEFQWLSALKGMTDQSPFRIWPRLHDRGAGRGTIGQLNACDLVGVCQDVRDRVPLTQRKANHARDLEDLKAVDQPAITQNKRVLQRASLLPEPIPRQRAHQSTSHSRTP